MMEIDEGHYYVLTKENNSDWYKFYDKYVEYFDLNNLENEIFGGVMNLIKL